MPKTQLPKSPDFWWRSSLTFCLTAVVVAVIIIRNTGGNQITQGLVEGIQNQPVAIPSFKELIRPVEPRFKIAADFNAASISAKQVIVADLATLKVLYGREATAETEPASTTKIVTAMVGLQTYSLDQKLITPKSCVGLNGNNSGLYPGEEISFKDLLYAMLLVSDTDATCTVYSNYPGGQPAFVAAMNTYVESLGIANAHFENPIGFDDGSWKENNASAWDLAVIAKSALQNETFKTVVGTKTYLVPGQNSNLMRSLVNTNELLGVYPGVFGVKTGNTDLAGQCLVTAYHLRDRDFIVVVLGSSDRFGDTKKILEWTKANVSWAS
ncbi:MAG: serine hydrolase [candidate division WWE3 bacterium]|nr:serine hydrolase [candidate division WWE3 bacterium]